MCLSISGYYLLFVALGQMGRGAGRWDVKQADARRSDTPKEERSVLGEAANIVVAELGTPRDHFYTFFRAFSVRPACLSPIVQLFRARSSPSAAVVT